MTRPTIQEPARTEAPAIPTTMQAVTRRRYGDVDVLQHEGVDVPKPKADEVLVRVHAAAVHRGDVHLMTGKPYLVRLMFGVARPKDPQLGQEAAGTVVAVGSEVRTWQVGDEVFGPVGSGAYAEYVCAPADRIARKPDSLTFEQAAAVGDSAMTALQAVRDIGRVRSGQRVLINGAAGGVGTFAVQIAKALGAHVTGVCSTSRVGKVRELGADRVVDYTREDFASMTSNEGAIDQPFDVVIDLVGNRSLRDCQRALTPTGILVQAAGGRMGNWIGPILWLLKVRLANLFTRRTMQTFLVDVNGRDLEVLRQMVANKEIVPVIEQIVPFEDVRTAVEHVARGHAFGKTVLAMVPSDASA